MDRKDRSSNFELLRIFAMLLIITYHYALFSNFRFSAGTLNFNRLFYQSMLLDGKTGVNLFVMISGYFMVKSRGVRTSKVLQLWGQCFFWIVGIWLVFHKRITGFGGMPQDTLKGKIFFLSSGVQWFISTYMVMYLLSPYINVMLTSLSRTAFRRMLVITGTFWCLIPTVSWIPGMFETDFEGNDLTFFIFLYCLGAYLRLYHGDIERSTGFWLRIAAGIYLLCIGIIAAVDLWGMKVMSKLKLLDYLFNYQNHVLILLLSLSLFLAFKEMRIPNSRVINLISSLTFGIYLIHDNWQIRRYFWNNIVRANTYQDSPWFFLISLGIILAIFIVCGILEFIRQQTAERLWMMAAVPVSERIDRAIGRYLP